MQPSAAERPRWWQWPTILSLDAPVVVVLWQWILAGAASVALGVPEAVVLGCSVWLAYAADRWIEACRLAPESIRTHRHRFHQRWRWPVFAAWAIVLGLDLCTAFRWLPPSELLAGAWVLVPVAAYLLSHQLVHRRSRWRAPKELCVAALLAGGAAVFIVCLPAADVGRMAIPLVLFALLCFSNCALISVWEDEVDRSQGQTSLALQLGRAAAILGSLPWAVALLCAAARLLAGRGAGTASLCGVASAVLLGLVGLAEPRIGRVRARVLADVALMTPVVPLLARLIG